MELVIEKNLKLSLNQYSRIEDVMVYKKLGNFGDTILISMIE
jgi:hypothetical protein